LKDDLTPPTPQPKETKVSSGLAPRGRLAAEVGCVKALWKRDMLRLRRDVGRWVGVVAQPLLFWVILGSGMGHVFQVPQVAGLDYLAFAFPGILAMVVLFTTIFATIAVIEDRQEGFLQQVLVAPASRLAMVLGKTCGVTTVALLQALLCLPMLPLAGYGFGEVAWAQLGLVLVLGSAGLAGLSFAMAWTVQSTQGYHALMTVLLIPLWLVSGAMFPAPDGGWVRAVMTVNPMTYLVDGLRHAITGTPSSVNFTDAGWDTAVLAGFALAALAAATLLARQVRR
jgi:daunorubicin resistance ABC transporter membrane protein